jgi:catechol 2,3-dioxygenase-like lactoylglutathione lyase family enzyme
MTIAQQHLAMRCRDLATSMEFYQTHLGFTVVRTFRDGEGNVFYMLRLGAFCLEMFQSDEPETAELLFGGIGPSHLAFSVDDLDAKVAELAAGGVEMGEIIDGGFYVPGLRLCFFEDPDGNRLEINEGMTDEVDA